MSDRRSYVPDVGEHKGHTVDVLSDGGGVRFNVLGQPLASMLVRCRTCLWSWALPRKEDDI